MVSSIASSLGFGSGIDTVGLVSDLAAASQAPKVQRLDALAKANQAKLSTLAQARNDLDSFADSLASLTSGGTLRSQPTTSNDSAVGVSAKSGTILGGLNAQVTVQTLAKSQTSYSAHIASRSNAIGQGTLSLNVGGNSRVITINAANDSLDGLASAINATGSGVRASVINDAGNFRLVLNGESGAANAFTLAADAGTPASLLQFTDAQLVRGQAAQDADFTVDGVAYHRPSNIIEDVIPGLTITLKKADPLSSVSIAATRPTEGIRQTLTDFVTVFNTLKRDVEAARKINNGSPALRAFERQLNLFAGQKLTSDSSVRSLSDVGISTNRDGTLTLNRAKLEAVLRDKPDAVEAMFNPPRFGTQTETTDPGIAFALDSLRDAAVSANGPLEQVRVSLQREADRIASNRTKVEQREDAYRNRLERQFAGMDARIGALKATQSYLEQQIKLWNSDNG